MQPFNLTFIGTDHGWLDLSLRVGEYSDEVAASRVLNDPIEETADAAAALSAAEPVQLSIRFFEEPGWTVLRFASERASTLVEVEVVEVYEGERTLSRLRADRRAVAEELLRTLSAIEETSSPAGVLEGWGEFPSEKLRGIRGPAAERTFVQPWTEARGFQRAVDEALVEIGPGHCLYGVDLEIAACSLAADAYLFRLRKGPNEFAVVHLTWSGRPERHPRWPSADLFSSWSDFVERRMDPDAADYGPE